EDAWMAWQFDRPDLGEGIVQAFRRTQSSILSCQYQLHGLEPDTQYELTNLDVSGVTRLTGRELMADGLIIDIADQPGAVVIKYKAIK
ncbi:MAG: GH36 C-terminal domain-containing protein, partial [Candidatus Poribacteria bacterium]|nr:GH36 C-terminal domain-containing protein [Candidatus Poribacteria bacterium]